MGKREHVSNRNQMIGQVETLSNRSYPEVCTIKRFPSIFHAKWPKIMQFHILCHKFGCFNEVVIFRSIKFCFAEWVRVEVTKIGNSFFPILAFLITGLNTPKLKWSIFMPKMNRREVNF